MEHYKTYIARYCADESPVENRQRLNDELEEFISGLEKAGYRSVRLASTEGALVGIETFRKRDTLPEFDMFPEYDPTITKFYHSVVFVFSCVKD